MPNKFLLGKINFKTVEENRNDKEFAISFTSEYVSRRIHVFIFLDCKAMNFHNEQFHTGGKTGKLF